MIRMMKPADKGGRSNSRGSNLRWEELGSVKEDDTKGEGDAHLPCANQSKRRSINQSKTRLINQSNTRSINQSKTVMYSLHCMVWRFLQWRIRRF